MVQDVKKRSMAMTKFTVYLEEETVLRLDELCTPLSERGGGIRVTRNGVARVALLRGVEALERELKG